VSEQNNKYGKYPKNALIEDVAKDFLDSEKMKNLLDFLEFLKNNKFTPQRGSSAKWAVKYKGKPICHLRLIVEDKGGGWSPTLTNCTIKDWRITHNHFTRDWFVNCEKYFADEEMKKFIWNHIQAPGCRPECGSSKTILGREFNWVCTCEPFGNTSPSGVELEYSKKLILIIKAYIADLAAAIKA